MDIGLGGREGEESKKNPGMTLTENIFRNSYQKNHTDTHCLGDKKHINHEINTNRKEKSSET